MKRIYLIALAAILAMSAMTARAVETHGRLDIDVWLDNEDGIYYEGENVTIFFQTSQDAYVAIYSLDTRGNATLLFPVDPRDNGFVRAGDVYAVPDRYDDYELYVSGPEGIEYVQAIASPVEMEIPDWFDGAGFQCDYYDDREGCLEWINERYFSSRWGNGTHAFDRASIYVKSPRYYYRPIYVPHQWYDYPHYSMVYIDYPFGAEIYIDGIFFGIAPLWIPRVIVGWHWFTIYDRYGYCWEQHINVYHNHTIRLDHSRVKTSRTTASRFKDVRTQARKYSRTDFVLSEKRVKTTRSVGSAGLSKKYSGSGYRTKTERGTRSSGTAGSKRSGYSTRDAHRRSSGTRDSRATRKTTPSQDRSGDYKRSGSSRRTPSQIRQRTPTKRSTGGSVERRSGSSKRGSGTTRKSGTVKKSGTPKKSSGQGSGPSRSGSSSIGKNGGGSRSSGSRTSSIGRSSAGRSAPAKSSSSKGKSSSGTGGKRR